MHKERCEKSCGHPKKHCSKKSKCRSHYQILPVAIPINTTLYPVIISGQSVTQSGIYILPPNNGVSFLIRGGGGGGGGATFDNAIGFSAGGGGGGSGEMTLMSYPPMMTETYLNITIGVGGQGGIGGIMG